MTELADKEVIGDICKYIRLGLLRYMPESIPFSTKNILANEQFAKDEDILMEQIETLLTDFIKEYKDE